MRRILGLDRLNRKLRALPLVAERRVREAMVTGANEIVAMMKSLVPIDSGDLRESIGWRWGAKAPKGSIKVASVNSLSGKIAITIFAGDNKAYYARLVEFGTAPHVNGGQYAGTQHPGTKAQPFFFVSFRALRRRTRSRITRAINKSAKEVAGRG